MGVVFSQKQACMISCLVVYTLLGIKDTEGQTPKGKLQRQTYTVNVMYGHNRVTCDAVMDKSLDLCKNINF